MFAKNKIGVLGLDSQSTCYYLDEINKAYKQEMGGYSTCPLVLINADFNKINPFLPSGFNELREYLTLKINELESLGVERVIVPNITLHEALEVLELDTYVLNPLHLIGDFFNSEGIREVVLLGTKHTMRSSYFKRVLGKHGIQLIIPEPRIFNFVEGFRKKVYAKLDCEKDRMDYQKHVSALMVKSPVVSACTELSMHYNDSVKNFYDLSNFQIRELMEWLTKEE